MVDQNRRSVLATLLASGAVLSTNSRSLARALPLSVPGASQARAIGSVPFSEPPVVRSEDGLLSTTLSVEFHEKEIEGEPARYRSYNGLFTGPTLRFKPGDVVRVNVDNRLPPEPHSSGHSQDPNIPHGFNVTNLHTHGLWVSPAGNSDNVLYSLYPGHSFQHEYLIPTEHVSGTFWYHPHKHGSVERQVSNGMSGALIIEGGIDDLPAIREARERLMVLQQIQPEPNEAEAAKIVSVRQIAGSPNKTTTINGLYGPTLKLAPGSLERWRLIAANYHDLLHIEIRKRGTEDTIAIYPIAYDGIPVRSVKATGRVRLAPGNRVDILVQPIDAGEYEIYKVGDGGQFDTDPKDEVIGFLQVSGPAVEPPPMPVGIPKEYSHEPIKESEVTYRRKVLFSIISEGKEEAPRFVVDNREFDPNRVDHVIQLGAVEEWRIENDSDDMHPFHIHVNPFEVIDSSDPLLEPGTWLDTVPIPPAKNGVPGYVVMRTRIQRFVGSFVLHCHILAHEDRGMMQLIEIR